MHSFKNYLNRLLQTSKKGMQRFPFSFATTLLAVFASAWLIIAQAGSGAHEVPLLITMAAWFFALASITLELSRFVAVIMPRILWACEIATLGLSVGWYVLLNTNHNAYYVAYLFFMLALFFVAFFFVMSHPDRSKIGAHFVKSFVLACAITGIIVAGLMICVSAVHGLLFKVPYFEQVLSIIVVFGFGFVALNTFLALLPEKDEEISVPNVMKTLTFYVAFPLFLALVLVLCLYLLKVLITQKIPSNQINLYVSLVSLVFIFFSFVLTAFKSRVIELFEKYMGYIVLPLIAMQVYVVGIRLNAYGYTPLRWASVVCIFLSVCFVVSTFFKRGALKRYVILLAALCMLVLSFGPLSILNVPARSQAQHLRSMLEQNNMWKDGRIVANPNAPQHLKSDITSSYKIVLGGSSVPTWLPQPSKNAVEHRELLGFTYRDNKELEKRFESAFGFPFTYEMGGDVTFSMKAYHEWTSITIKPYEQLYVVSKQGERTESASPNITTIAYGTHEVDLKPYLHTITSPDDPAQLRIKLNDDAVLYIKNVMYEEDAEGEAVFFEFDGFVLSR